MAFNMALYHKWDVKNDFAYVLQFFSLISDGLGGVISVSAKSIFLQIPTIPIFMFRRDCIVDTI